MRFLLLFWMLSAFPVLNWAQHSSTIKPDYPDDYRFKTPGNQVPRSSAVPARRIIAVGPNAFVLLYDDHFCVDFPRDFKRSTYPKGIHEEQLNQMLTSKNLMGYDIIFKNLAFNHPIKGKRFYTFISNIFATGKDFIPDLDTTLILYHKLAKGWVTDYVMLDHTGKLTIQASTILNTENTTPVEFAKKQEFSSYRKWQRRELLAYPDQMGFMLVSQDSALMSIEPFPGKSEYENDYFKTHRTEYKDESDEMLKNQQFDFLIGLTDNANRLFFTDPQGYVNTYLLDSNKVIRSSMFFPKLKHARCIRGTQKLFLSTDEGCFLYDAQKDSIIYRIPGTKAADISLYGEHVLVDIGGRLFYHDGQTGALIQEHSFNTTNTMSAYQKQIMKKVQASFIDSNGNWCVVGDDHVKVINKTTKKEIKAIPLPQERNRGIYQLANGRVLLMRNVNNDSLLVFTPETGSWLPVALSEYMSFGVSVDGKLLMTRHKNEERVNLYDLTKKTLLKSLTIPEIKGAFDVKFECFKSAAGPYLLGMNTGYKQYWYNLDSLNLLSNPPSGPEAKYNQLLLSRKDYNYFPMVHPNGKQIVASNIHNGKYHEFGSLQLNNISDTAVYKQKLHRSTIHYYSFSPDGKWLATAGEEGKNNGLLAYLWKAEFDASGKFIRYLKVDSLGTIEKPDPIVARTDSPQPQSKDSDISKNTQTESEDYIYTRTTGYETSACSRDLIVHGFTSTCGDLNINLKVYKNGDINLKESKVISIERPYETRGFKFTDVHYLSTSEQYIYLESSGKNYYDCSVGIYNNGKLVTYYFRIPWLKL